MATSLRRILVATDFSPPSYRALQIAKDYARHFDASLVIFHALFLTENLFGAGSFAFPDTVNQIQEAAKTEVGKLVSEVTAEGIGCEGVVVRGAPDEEIHRYLANANNKIDLVVVGTVGRTGLARVAFGSVAQRIVQGATCPTLVVPAPREGA